MTDQVLTGTVKGAGPAASTCIRRNSFGNFVNVGRLCGRALSTPTGPCLIPAPYPLRNFNRILWAGTGILVLLRLTDFSSASANSALVSSLAVDRDARSRQVSDSDLPA